MGTWGTGSFDNDGASDWVYELEAEGIDAIESALEAVASSGDYLDAPDGANALAAAEVIAAILGKPVEGLPEEVVAFVAHNPAVEPSIIVLARKVIERILADGSELRELWEESEEYDEWRGAVVDLRRRLAQ